MDQKNTCRNRSGFYDSGVIALIEAIVRQAAKDHLAALARLGPCPEHRMSFGPVRGVLDALPFSAGIV